jgi:hypothetical protein
VEYPAEMERMFAASNRDRENYGIKFADVQKNAAGSLHSTLRQQAPSCGARFGWPKASS